MRGAERARRRRWHPSSLVPRRGVVPTDGPRVSSADCLWHTERPKAPPSSAAPLVARPEPRPRVDLQRCGVIGRYPREPGCPAWPVLPHAHGPGGEGDDVEFEDDRLAVVQIRPDQGAPGSREDDLPWRFAVVDNARGTVRRRALIHDQQCARSIATCVMGLGGSRAARSCDVSEMRWGGGQSAPVSVRWRAGAPGSARAEVVHGIAHQATRRPRTSTRRPTQR